MLLKLKILSNSCIARASNDTIHVKKALIERGDFLKVNSTNASMVTG
jgi:hypothetical protein